MRVNSELKQAQLELLSSAPTAYTGRVYFDTTQSKPFINLDGNSTGWRGFNADKVTAVTGTTTISDTYTDLYLLSTSGSDYTITLPDASNSGTKRFLFKLADTSATDDVVTIAAGGSDTIEDGTETSLTLRGNFNFVELTSDGTSKWHVTRSSARGHRVVTGADTLTILDEVILCTATSTGYTLGLPTAVGFAGKRFFIKRTDDNQGNVITVDPNSSETIDGLTTMTLVAQEDYLELISDGANWLTTKKVTKDMIRVHTVAASTGGWGTTNTAIRRFSTVDVSVGTSITRATSAAAGDSYTINADGVYAITYMDNLATTHGFGITLNASELTASNGIYGLTDETEVLTAMDAKADSDPGSVSWIGHLTDGDIIRPHTENNNAGSPLDQPKFTIVRVA